MAEVGQFWFGFGGKTRFWFCTVQFSDQHQNQHGHSMVDQETETDKSRDVRETFWAETEMRSEIHVFETEMFKILSETRSRLDI